MARNMRQFSGLHDGRILPFARARYNRISNKNGGHSRHSLCWFLFRFEQFNHRKILGTQEKK